ncbi:MAG: T9SS type A sorting domain-containing protein, partial [Ignavibacteriaceae bacterium]|nr:T9SS type A sorting domain-containing protein [Ignavibacteriaceae bacterium]
ALVSLFVLFAVSTAFSQYWTPLGNFPNDDFMKTSGHGIAVDPDGKVWLSPYYATEPIDTGSGGTRNSRALYVFYPDGTPAPFSPVTNVTLGGETEYFWNSARGLKTDVDGNIVAGFYDTYYIINYTDGEGMGKFTPYVDNGVTACAVDGNNNIFTAHVLPPSPITMFSPTFDLLSVVIAEAPGYSRTLEVSDDGNTVYWTGYTNNQVFIYSRPSEFDEWALTDSMAQGFACESVVWSPDKKYLWMSSGSYSGPANAYPGVETFYTTAAHYAFDMSTGEIVDSLIWQFTVPESADERNRGIAFSPDYHYAYVTCFGGDAYVPMQKFENPNWTSVDNEGQVVVNGYKLSQNYPNPFNPSTKISFELPNSGFVSLKVYDMLGREIAVLVDKEMTSGSHTVNFNAANLASGNYVYQLTSNGNVLTNKMVLLK